MALATLALTLTLLGAPPPAAAAAAKPTKEKAMTLHDLQAQTLEGQPKALRDYAGKVLLVVNTASECGYTPQYAGLEKLHQELSGQGLVVLGFPSNDFGGQEPGGAAEIRQFCTKRYGVTFPLFEKVKTKGPDAHPIYAFLAARHGAPAWNFHKYLVDKKGEVVAAFKSGVAPDSAELKNAIAAALAK
jgi:glutathione peroxidase